jgi:hypothetical protein
MRRASGQSSSRQPLRRSIAIKAVAQDQAADRGEMGTQLVRPSGQRLHSSQAISPSRPSTRSGLCRQGAIRRDLVLGQRGRRAGPRAVLGGGDARFHQAGVPAAADGPDQLGGGDIRLFQAPDHQCLHRVYERDSKPKVPRPKFIKDPAFKPHDGLGSGREMSEVSVELAGPPHRSFGYERSLDVPAFLKRIPDGTMAERLPPVHTFGPVDLDGLAETLAGLDQDGE